MESQEKQNLRLGKLETFFLILFGVTLAVWIINKFVNISFLLTVSLTGLFVSSIALLILVLRSLLQRKIAKKK